MLHTLMHGLEGTADVGTEQLWVYVDQGIIHPGVVPLQPAGSHYPEVLVGLKVPRQLSNLHTIQSFSVR